MLYNKQTAEIDRVMKKVDEGVELFDEIWDKVYAAEQQNQKEKYEMDLKKEIKKLQRLRDQIKSWIGSSDVKDKDPLIDARKLIETKMEAFKYCEKETKTKTYSKEGLAKAEKLTPEEEAKKATSEWITEIIEKLTEMAEERDLEVERLGAGRGKKTNKNLIEECNHFLAMHKFHLTKLEGIMRLVNNDVLDVDVVDPIKEDLEYYLDSYDDDDYQQAYDEDFFYEALGLDELQVINVDRVTQASAEKEKNSKKSDLYSDLASSSSKGSEKGSKKSKKGSSASMMIPLTIGRARKGSKKAARALSTGSVKGGMPSSGSSMNDTSHSGDDDSTHGNTPTKSSSNSSSSRRAISMGSDRGSNSGSVPTPTIMPTTIPANQGTSAGTSSMAAILKRETEQQEKERAQKVGFGCCIYWIVFYIVISIEIVGLYYIILCNFMILAGEYNIYISSHDGIVFRS
jgi:CCR4-NOT transcription complex subunit 3